MFKILTQKIVPSEMFVNNPNMPNVGIFPSLQNNIHQPNTTDRPVHQHYDNNYFALMSSLYSGLQSNFLHMPNVFHQQFLPNFNFTKARNLDRILATFRPQPYIHSQVPASIYSTVPKKAAKEPRLVCTSEQTQTLEQVYANCKSLCGQRLDGLIERTQLTGRQLKCWWLCRRKKDKKRNNKTNKTPAATKPLICDDEQKPREKRGSRRMNFSQNDVDKLEQEYRQSKYLTRNRKVELVAELKISEKRIATWFNNRRMREKSDDIVHQLQFEQETMGYSSASPSFDVDNVQPMRTALGQLTNQFRVSDTELEE